jgi:hypothetical protein
MVLPADETPSIATVLDKDKLDGQAFFANAQNGDKMIIYTNAKKAILFRPSEKLVVEVMPLLIGDNAASPTPAPSASTENSTSNTFSEGE